MSTYTITYDAKCKHCDEIEPYKEGKRKYHWCKLHDIKVRLKDKACNDFTL